MAYAYKTPGTQEAKAGGPPVLGQLWQRSQK
jgi:hypothetical protein